MKLNPTPLNVSYQVQSLTEEQWWPHTKDKASLRHNQLHFIQWPPSPAILSLK